MVLGCSRYFLSVTETGIWKVAPWHPFCDAVLIAAVPGRSIRCDPAGTVMEGLPGKVIVTPVVVQVPVPPEAVTEPFSEMADMVSAKAFVLLIRTTTSLEPPGISAVLGASPPVKAATLTAETFPVVAAADPDPRVFQ
jgi:hypothetical protein